jgi:hypothetical protein
MSKSPLFSNRIDGNDAEPSKIEAPEDETAEQLREIRSSGIHSKGEAVLKELQKRKLVQPR